MTVGGRKAPDTAWGPAQSRGRAFRSGSELRENLVGNEMKCNVECPLSQIKQLNWAMCTSGLSAAVATVELEV